MLSLEPVKRESVRVYRVRVFVRRVSSLQRTKLCKKNRWLRWRRRRRRWFDDKKRNKKKKKERRRFLAPSTNFFYEHFLRGVPRQVSSRLLRLLSRPKKNKKRARARERFTPMARRLSRNDALIAYPCKWRSRLSVLKRERNGRKWSARVSEICCFHSS